MRRFVYLTVVAVFLVTMQAPAAALLGEDFNLGLSDRCVSISVTESGNIIELTDSTSETAAQAIEKSCLIHSSGKLYLRYPVRFSSDNADAGVYRIEYIFGHLDNGGQALIENNAVQTVTIKATFSGSTIPLSPAPLNGLGILMPTSPDTGLTVLDKMGLRIRTSSVRMNRPRPTKWLLAESKHKWSLPSWHR